MSKSIKELFVDVINKGVKTADKIPDAYNKGMVYAALAQAIAQTGLVGGASNMNMDTPDEVSGEEAAAPAKTEVKAEAAKTAPAPGKNKSSLAPGASKNKKEEAPEAAPEQQPELTEEWTDEAMEILKVEIEKFSKYRDAYGDETICNCIKAFSEDQYTEISDINPLNLQAFVAYLEMLEANQE